MAWLVAMAKATAMWLVGELHERTSKGERWNASKLFKPGKRIGTDSFTYCSDWLRLDQQTACDVLWWKLKFHEALSTVKRQNHLIQVSK